MKTFNDYNFNEFTKKFISLNKFEKPTPIQDAVIPYAIRGRDIIAISATGTGKTHAFLIPIMEKLILLKMKYKLLSLRQLEI